MALNCRNICGPATRRSRVPRRVCGRDLERRDRDLLRREVRLWPRKKHPTRSRPAKQVIIRKIADRSARFARASPYEVPPDSQVSVFLRAMHKVRPRTGSVSRRLHGPAAVGPAPCSLARASPLPSAICLRCQPIERLPNKQLQCAHLRISMTEGGSDREFHIRSSEDTHRRLLIRCEELGVTI